MTNLSTIVQIKFRQYLQNYFIKCNLRFSILINLLPPGKECNKLCVTNTPTTKCLEKYSSCKLAAPWPDNLTNCMTASYSCPLILINLVENKKSLIIRINTGKSKFDKLFQLYRFTKPSFNKLVFFLPVKYANVSDQDRENGVF